MEAGARNGTAAQRPPAAAPPPSSRVVVGVGGPLKILIAGGGIAGLSCAIALRRAGHAVAIYERSRFDNEVGAALHLPPNATRPLLAWGLDPVRARLVLFKSSRFVDGKTLDVMRDVELGDGITREYGAPWLAAHRVDLHEELRRSEVMDYDTDRPSVTLRSGEVVHADMVVAADGIHSRAPELLVGRSEPALPAGLYNFCYRFLVPASELEADPATRFWNEDTQKGHMKSYVDKTKRLINYTCRDNEVHNFAGLFHRDAKASMNEEDWHAPVNKSRVMETFSDFHPKLLAAIDKATEFKEWPLLYRAPIPTYTKGRLVVVGDAAHPMLPFQGQGGAQAIEDAVALGIALEGATAATLDERLALYNRIRRNRGSVLQVMSNAGQDESHKIQEEAAKYMPAELVPKSPEECMVYNFTYDIVKDSVEKLEEVDHLAARSLKLKLRLGVKTARTNVD